MDDYMYGERPKWKDKYWREVAHSGYAEVSYEDVWSLDTRLARIISVHLRAFLKAQKGPNAGCPGKLAAGCSVTEAHKKWLTIIRKMLYAFEEYQWCVGGNDFDNLPVEKQEKIKEGMQLFIDYFRDLWI
jgi:hypothetical protein